MAVKPRSRKLHTMTMTALMAAVLCVLSPVAIPVGPVPVTLSIFGSKNFNFSGSKIC